MAGIPYVDMAAQFAAERERLMPVVESVLAGGMWVGGAAVEAFEAAVRAYTGAAHTDTGNTRPDQFCCICFHFNLRWIGLMG